MLLSVAICTWNRSGLLKQTLARMRSLSVPPGDQWELLVVDNNSTDDTADVLRRHAERGDLPLRVLFEPRPGQSSARNRAIAAAQGDFIIWTDDDVLVDPNWLVAYAAAFRRWPEATFFGGPIRPWFEQTPPPWIPHLLGPCKHLWAVLDLGRASGPMGPDECPFGANMAVAGEVQRQNLFDPGTGHCAGTLVGGDETSLFRKLRFDGHIGVWVAEAALDHFIPTERMTLEYVRTRAQQYGYQNHDVVQDANAKRLFGIPCYVVRRYWASLLLAHLHPVRSGRVRATAVYAAAQARGMIRRIRDEKGIRTIVEEDVRSLASQSVGTDT